MPYFSFVVYKLDKFHFGLQVTARREQDERAKQRDALEFNEDQKGDEEYDDFLRQETERMRLKGFTPRVSLTYLHCRMIDSSFSNFTICLVSCVKPP